MFQYLELTIIPDTDITPFIDRNIPFIVHMTPDIYGVNLGDCKAGDLNHRIIHLCCEWADQLKATYIILHPGFGNLDCVLGILEGYDDPRILIENMPKKGTCGEKMVGFLPDQIHLICQEKFGFCLDLNHAIKAALSLKMDYRQIIEEFLLLHPTIFHLSDGSLHRQIDEHLSFGEGSYPLPYLMNCLKRQENPYVTLETPRASGSLNDDLNNLKELQRYAQ